MHCSCLAAPPAPAPASSAVTCSGVLQGRDPPWHRAEGQPSTPGWTRSAETKQRGFASLRFSPKERHMALAGLFSPRWAAGCVSSAAAAPVAHSAHPMPGSIARLPSPRAPPSALRSAPLLPRRGRRSLPKPPSTDSAIEPTQTKGAALIFDKIQTN